VSNDAETLIDRLFENKAFRSVTAEQRAEYKELLTELLKKLEGKSGLEALPVLMEYSKRAPKGMKFSKEEETAMVAAFAEIIRGIM